MGSLGRGVQVRSIVRTLGSGFTSTMWNRIRVQIWQIYRKSTNHKKCQKWTASPYLELLPNLLRKLENPWLVPKTTIIHNQRVSTPELRYEGRMSWIVHPRLLDQRSASTTSKYKIHYQYMSIFQLLILKLLCEARKYRLNHLLWNALISCISKKILKMSPHA